MEISSTIVFDSSVDLPELKSIELGNETLYGRCGKVDNESSCDSGVTHNGQHREVDSDSEITLVMKGSIGTMGLWKIFPIWK